MVSITGHYSNFLYETSAEGESEYELDFLSSNPPLAYLVIPPQSDVLLHYSSASYKVSN